MKRQILLVSFLSLVGNLSGCSAGDANAYVKDNFSDPQVRALVIAADEGDVKQIDQLVSSGVNVNARGNDGITPLIWTIFHHKKIGYEALLERGADPNLQMQSGRHEGDSAMETAAQEQDSSYLKLALEHGGNPNLVDKNDGNRRTPLFGALLSNAKENVTLLIHAGADVNFVDDSIDNENLLESAIGMNDYEIAYQLLQAGANYRLKDQAGANKGGNPIVWDLEHPGSLDTASDAYKWRAKVIDFMNANGVKVRATSPTTMCAQDMGKGVNVLAPCDQLKNNNVPQKK